MSTCIPLFGVAFAIDPFLAVFGFVGLGLAAGPAVAIAREHGHCDQCTLEREGLAFRRLGIRKYLSA